MRTVKRRSLQRGPAFLAGVVAFSCAFPADGHEMWMPRAMKQPASPVRLRSCYLGTDFMFGDPKLKPEETKMQLSADLEEPAPSQYRMLGLRFEFGARAGRRTSDVVIFTGSKTSDSRNIMAAPPGLDPSGYLPRVPGYDDVECGVDFATSLDRKSAWFDAASDVVACETPKPVPETPSVWLDALELQSAKSDAVFLMADEKQKGVYSSVDGSAPVFTPFDAFGRAVVSLGRLSDPKHVLTFGGTPARLDQQVCFRPFSRSQEEKAL